MTRLRLGQMNASPPILTIVPIECRGPQTKTCFKDRTYPPPRVLEEKDKPDAIPRLGSDVSSIASIIKCTN